MPRCPTTSAICASCLQHAYLHEKKCLGYCYYSRRQLAQRHGGIMSPASFSPSIPQVDPQLYQEIFGRPCEHRFKKGGFGRARRTPLGTRYSDGTHNEWHVFLPRLTLVEGIYHCYQATGNASLARETYQVIDELLPVDAEEIRHYKELLDLGDRLKKVSNEEEWMKLLSELRSLKRG